MPVSSLHLERSWAGTAGPLRCSRQHLPWRAAMPSRSPVHDARGERRERAARPPIPEPVRPVRAKGPALRHGSSPRGHEVPPWQSGLSGTAAANAQPRSGHRRFAPRRGRRTATTNESSSAKKEVRPVARPASFSLPAAVYLGCGRSRMRRAMRFPHRTVQGVGIDPSPRGSTESASATVTTVLAGHSRLKHSGSRIATHRA